MTVVNKGPWVNNLFFTAQMRFESLGLRTTKQSRSGSKMQANKKSMGWELGKFKLLYVNCSSCPLHNWRLNLT